MWGSEKGEWIQKSQCWRMCSNAPLWLVAWSVCIVSNRRIVLLHLTVTDKWHHWNQSAKEVVWGSLPFGGGVGVHRRQPLAILDAAMTSSMLQHGLCAWPISITQPRCMQVNRYLYRRLLQFQGAIGERTLGLFLRSLRLPKIISFHCDHSCLSLLYTPLKLASNLFQTAKNWKFFF